MIAITTHDLNDVIFRVAQVLEVPVLLAALLALGVALYECGAFVVEGRHQRRRRFAALEAAAARARVAVAAGERAAAEAALRPIARSAAMMDTLAVIVAHAGEPGGETRIAKALADFDFDIQRRLERTRLLVRVGPALGLMGTLIPLSPALTGLAQGNIGRLTENLRVAFSVTVLGLLIGAIGFALSLYRDRLYGQDLSDLEYVAAVLTADEHAEVIA